MTRRKPLIWHLRRIWYAMVWPPRWWLEWRNAHRMRSLDEMVAGIEGMYLPGVTGLREQADDMHFWAESARGRSGEWERYCDALRVVEQKHPKWL